MISVVVPVFNERENIEPLAVELSRALAELAVPFEILIVDDGSTDGTFEELRRVASATPGLRAVRFSRNFGQTAALAAGIARARYGVIVTIDGDLENDPADIKTVLAKLNEGYDIVSGWRRSRWADQKLTRRLPSRVANWLISKISGVYLHDYGCTLKAYRTEVVNTVKLYGDMHRFIPAYAQWRGARVVEVPVGYRPRKFGKSKYGFSRTFRVLLDLVFMKFLLSYMNRPIHFFGGIGLASLLLGFLAAGWAIALKVLGLRTFVATPLPIFSALFTIVGFQFLVMGVLAEIIMRTYYESQKKTTYDVREEIGGKD